MEFVIYVVYAVIQSLLAVRYWAKPASPEDGPVFLTILGTIFAPLLSAVLFVMGINRLIQKLVIRKAH